MQATKILILGATGMLGHALFKHFSSNHNYTTFGSVRSLNNLSQIFSTEEQIHLIPTVEATNFDSIIHAFTIAKPNIVINCIGIVKQSQQINDHYLTINVNSLFPHRLASLCSINNTNLIHVSTDCVFDGKNGGNVESDTANATDLYGRSKFLGEVKVPNTLTIRTSIIGHELSNKIALVDWFLAQVGSIYGYTNAIFSGVTVFELAKIIEQYVLPNNLSGLYHISTQPISKYHLLQLVANIYAKQILINPMNDFHLDHSLNSDKFRQETGFKPKPWLQMIQEMHNEFITHPYYNNRC